MPWLARKPLADIPASRPRNAPRFSPPRWRFLHVTGCAVPRLKAIAAEADMSKQNLLYYFDGKEAIFVELIQQLTDLWLEPLAQIDPEGEPVAEILAYVQRKLVISQEHPRESRLFAIEIVQGVPHIKHLFEGPMKDMVDRTVALLQAWMDSGRLRAVDPA